jgi:hypothetical protein
MTLSREQGTAAAWDSDGVLSDDRAVRSRGTLAEPTNPAPNAAMPPKRTRLPLEKVVDRSFEPLTCDPLKRSLTVPSESGLDQDQRRWPVSWRCNIAHEITQSNSAILSSLILPIII